MDTKSCPIVSNKYALIGIGVGLFLAGLGIGYAVLINTYNPYAMMGNPTMFNQMMSQNPKFMGPWMGTMMSSPQLRQQMIEQMYQNQGFMQQMMQNQQFQQNWWVRG